MLKASAGATTLIDADVQDLSVFSGDSATTGSNTVVFGGVFAGADGTIGANSYVSGNVTTVGKAMIGEQAAVGAGVASGSSLMIGDGALVSNAALAAGTATVGADVLLGDSVSAAGTVTTGTGSFIGENVSSGGAASIGGDGYVGGAVMAVGAIGLGTGASVGSQSALTVSPVDATALTASLVSEAAADRQNLLGAQAAFLTLTTTGYLAPVIATNTTLLAGVYSAASLSIDARTTLTLNGQGLTNQSWVFNIADLLATGASSNIVLINGGVGDSIIWNTGGAASLGAGSSFLGTLLADSSIAIGANAKLSSVGGSCGGVFSTNSTVTVSIGATIGDGNCSGVDQGFQIAPDGQVYHSGEAPPTGPAAAVPEASSWAMLIVGLGVIGAMLRRRGEMAMA